MPVKLNSTSGGSVTLDVGSTASNFTQNLPLATTTLVGTDSTQTLSNKTFSGATTFGSASLAAPDGSAPLYMCRAWVKFNLTGAISGSGNVSSVTDTSTSNKSINLINAMPDVNYVTSICQNQNTGAAYSATMTQLASSTASRVDIWNVNELTDVTGWMVSVIR